MTAIAVSLSAPPEVCAKSPKTKPEPPQKAPAKNVPAKKSAPAAKAPAKKAPASKPNPPARRSNCKKNGKKKGKGDGKPDEVHQTVITSVDLDSITVKQDTTTKEYKVTKDTTIELKGQKASLFDLKEGMRVSITIGFDPKILDRIIANDAPPKAAASKDSGKKKKSNSASPTSESSSGS